MKYWEFLIQKEGDHELVQAALAMANRSYAPYSKNYAGVALRLANGRIFSAPYAENAAFNPSLSPLHGALIAMRIKDQPWDQIVDAVLVERPNASCRQEPIVRTLLATLSEASFSVRYIERSEEAFR